MAEGRFTVLHVCRVCGEVKPILACRAQASSWICTDCRRATRLKHTVIRPMCGQSRQGFDPNVTVCSPCANQGQAQKKSASAGLSLEALIGHLIATAETRPDDCLEWPRRRNWGGYGIAKVDGQDIRAHRLVWERKFGPIPEGLYILHRCDNPPCINPHHLWLGTKRDNTRDMMAKGRHSNRRKRGPD